MTNSLSNVSLLTAQEDRTSFDCGVSALNIYLKQYALQNQKKDIVRNYVVTREKRVVGYYSLAYGSVSRSDMPLELSKGLPDYPVPIILLARLAIDLTEKGQGLGAALLKDAMLRTLQASEIAGLRALFVHAKDEGASQFYQKYAFIPSPANQLHLFLPLTTLKKVIV